MSPMELCRGLPPISDPELLLCLCKFFFFRNHIEMHEEDCSVISPLHAILGSTVWNTVFKFGLLHF